MTPGAGRMMGATPRDAVMDLILYQAENRMGRSYFSEPLREFEAPEGEETPAPWTPVVEVLEEADRVRVVAELPGVKAKDVRVWLEGHRLTISGIKTQTEEEPAVNVQRDERTYGEFKRTFGLTPVIEFEKATAHYKLGVLTVTLPKAESAKRRQIPVSE